MNTDYDIPKGKVDLDWLPKAFPAARDEFFSRNANSEEKCLFDHFTDKEKDYPLCLCCMCPKCSVR